MSLNPISFQDIVLYAQVYEVEDFQLFCHLIQQLDNVFLNYQSKKIKQKSKSP